MSSTIQRYYSLLLGNFLEFYDFTLFAYLIPVISPLLFPSTNIIDSYRFAYIFLAIGFLSRPAGAIIFGHIGDKYGRKAALLLSISAMSLATTVISFLPTNNPDWVIVFALLAICRIIQGLSAGGEYSGAGLLLIEGVQEEKQFINGAVLTASALLGAFAASFAAAIIGALEYSTKAWRFLFLFGGIIGAVCFWLRATIVTEPQKINFSIDNSSNWAVLFKNYKKQLFLVVLCSALMNVPFQMITGFLNTYLVATGKFEKTTLMFINSAVVFICAVVTIIFGLFTRIADPVKMMLYASSGMVLFSFPFFILIEFKTLPYFLIGEIILILLSQFFVAPAFTVMAKLFPYQLRYRGVAMGNCLGLAFLGGGTPYICSYLVKITGYSWAPIFYLFIISGLGLLASLSIRAELAKVSIVK